MPLFDFQCSECGHEAHDVLVFNWADAVGKVRECPYCHVMMHKKVPAPAFQVNGFNAKNGYSGGK